MHGRSAIQVATRTQWLIARIRSSALGFNRRSAPWWWEFESELKARIALENLLRRMFAMVPMAA
ncbi:MAG: hypothetical protein EAZ43_07275 [Betaproteobacteria bacterium]|nr:MAG: hypothetical protein EAZ43_07275 [Betaproteobacteria bacterium]